MNESFRMIIQILIETFRKLYYDRKKHVNREIFSIYFMRRNQRMVISHNCMALILRMNLIWLCNDDLSLCSAKTLMSHLAHSTWSTEKSHQTVI